MPNALRTHIDLSVPDVLVRADARTGPVLSVYADWDVSGRGRHEAATVIRKQLHEAGGLLLPRGATRESFDTDVKRVLASLDEPWPEISGLAIFACTADDLWLVIPLAITVPTLAHVGEHALLLPLARATQDAAPTLVVLGDTTELRLIALEHPHPRELEDLRGDTWGSARSTSRTGWRRGHVQHAYETELARFARRAGRAIAEVMRTEAFARLAVVGDEVFVPALLDALSPELRDRVVVQSHLGMSASLDDVAATVWPLVRQHAAVERQREAVEIIERAGGSLEAVSEPVEVWEMLRGGRVDTVVVDGTRVEPDAAELLLREALSHRSRVLLVGADEGVEVPSGLAATLR